MKKQIFLTSTMAAALTALSGCASGDDWNEDIIASDDTAICVDQNGNRFYGSRYYINRGSRVPYLGDSIRDTRYKFAGSLSPMPGVNYARAPSASRITRSAAIARGGFGSSSRGFGGGRS
jgi:hypothetical protein